MQHVWGKLGVRTGFWWGKLSEIDSLEDPDVDWRIILKWIFKKLDGRAWTGFVWRTGEGSNEPLGSIK